LDSLGVVTSINDVIMEAKRVEPELKIDKKMLLGKCRKLYIFKNLFLLFYWPKIREHLRVDGVLYTTPFEL